MTITGEQITAFRKATRRSRDGFAREVGLSGAKLSNLEKGRPFKPGELEALMSCADLVGWLSSNGHQVAPITPETPSALENGLAPVVLLGEDEEEDQELPFPSCDDDAISEVENLEAIVETHQADSIADYLERDDGIRRISNGELRCFKRCRRRWWLAYYRRLGLPEDKILGPAAIGTRVHNALRVWYVPEGVERGNPLEELDRSVQADAERLAHDPIALEKLHKEADLARAMVEGYFEWLAETGADEHLRIVAAETRLEVDSRIPNVNLIAKIDVRAQRTIDDARLFLDHKTVGDLKTPTKMLAFDEQMLHYHLCEFLDLLGDEQGKERTDGAIYNMLRKVKRTAQATPPFYDRVEVRHNTETLRSYWLRVQGVVRDIQRLEADLEAGMDPRMVAYPYPTKDCSWDCDFYHVCTMFDDGSRAEDMLAENYVVVNPLRRYETTERGDA